MVIATENVTLDEAFCKNHLEATVGEYVQSTVSDTGHGKDGEPLKHIYDSFFTTKGVGKGTGLGLVWFMELSRAMRAISSARVNRIGVN